MFRTGYVGGFDGASQGVPEPSVGYHAKDAGILTAVVSTQRDRVRRAV
jgi:hypothetical protein